MTMQPWDLSSVVDPRRRCPLHERSPTARSATGVARGGSGRGPTSPGRGAGSAGRDRPC